MDFGLSEEQQAIFDMAREFGTEHIAPFSRAWEAAGTIPRDLWAKVAELGGMLPGLTPDGGTSPETFEAFVRAEIAKWTEVVRRSGATGETNSAHRSG